MNHPAVRPRLGSLSGEGKKNYLLRGHLSKMPWKNCSVELVANWLNIEWTRRNKLVTGRNCKFNPPILLCVSLPGLWGAGVYPSYHEARESLLFPLLSEKKDICGFSSECCPFMSLLYLALAALSSHCGKVIIMLILTLPGMSESKRACQRSQLSKTEATSTISK